MQYVILPLNVDGFVTPLLIARVIVKTEQLMQEKKWNMFALFFFLPDSVSVQSIYKQASKHCCPRHEVACKCYPT